MEYLLEGPVLVTGGAGFIGSHISDRLVDNGIDVIALDNLSTGMISNLSKNEGKKNFRFIKEDLNNAVVINLPENKDVNDIYLREGADWFKDKIK